MLRELPGWNEGKKELLCGRDIKIFWAPLGRQGFSTVKKSKIKAFEFLEINSELLVN